MCIRDSIGTGISVVRITAKFEIISTYSHFVPSCSIANWYEQKYLQHINSECCEPFVIDFSFIKAENQEEKFHNYFFQKCLFYNNLNPMPFDLHITNW